MIGFRACLAALLCLSPLCAAAHPHVFVDAAARFVVDAQGRLTAVRIEHAYDPLVTLFVLQEFGVDPFAPLSETDAARLAADQRTMLADVGGFLAVSLGGEDLALSPLEQIEVGMADERMKVSFTAPLATPVALEGRAATLALFDPVHFVAFALPDAPAVEGPGGCAATAVEWAPTDWLMELQTSLYDLAVDETPQDDSVGRLFAAEARLTCP